MLKSETSCSHMRAPKPSRRPCGVEGSGLRPWGCVDKRLVWRQAMKSGKDRRPIPYEFSLCCRNGSARGRPSPKLVGDQDEGAADDSCRRLLAMDFVGERDIDSGTIVTLLFAGHAYAMCCPPRRRAVRSPTRVGNRPYRWPANAICSRPSDARWPASGEVMPRRHPARRRALWGHRWHNGARPGTRAPKRWRARMARVARVDRRPTVERADQGSAAN